MEIEANVLNLVEWNIHYLKTIDQQAKKKYLLSMKDLNTIEYLDKIIESGVSSLKIEGRMKSKEYVYSVVSSYRKAIDNYYSTHSNKIDAKT